MDLPRKRVVQAGKRITMVYGGEHIPTTEAATWLKLNPSYTIRGVIHDDDCWTLADSKETMLLICQALKLCPSCLQSIAGTSLDHSNQTSPT